VAGRLPAAVLARRAARGERRAFEQIYRRFNQELYRYCLAILRDPHDAEDALQATMAAALRALPGERRHLALRPWLYRVAHNESVSLLRGRGAPGPVEPDAILAAEPSAEVHLERRSRLRRLVADLRSLPERQRSAIVMRELSGLSYEDIGGALQSSEAAARQTVYEARTALRDLEEGREMECEVVREALSMRDGRRLRGRKLRSHLATCDGCRGFGAAIGQRRDDLQALCPPLPALAASGLLASLVGGSAAGGAGGTVGATGVGAGAAGMLGGGLAGSAAVKGVSLAAAVALAAGAADIGGVINLPSPISADERTDPDGEAPGGAGARGTSDLDGGGAPEPAAATSRHRFGVASQDGGQGTASGASHGARNTPAAQAAGGATEPSTPPVAAGGSEVAEAPAGPGREEPDEEATPPARPRAKDPGAAGAPGWPAIASPGKLERPEQAAASPDKPERRERPPAAERSGGAPDPPSSSNAPTESRGGAAGSRPDGSEPRPPAEARGSAGKRAAPKPE